MKTIINEIVTNWFSGIIPHLAILGILATFKDGRHFKESQLENSLPIIGIFAATLDYTCNASRLAIWGEAYRLSLVMTRLWLNIRPIYHNEISRSLILLQMDELNVYLRFGRNFARPRLFLNAGRN